ncbi:MAG: tetratricopeptide repeat protein [Spirochaetales bacterium]|nr:tetratricopeptide repeat protein [Spirochaetales bacterium]
MLAFLLIFCAGNAAGQADLLEKGEQLYLENRFEEALPVLESAVVQHPQNERLYLYLGTVYEHMGMYEKAVSILQKGTIVADLYLDLMYFNIANNLFRQRKTALADEMYSRCITDNPRFAEAYLNRANNRVEFEDFSGAVDDYNVYLNLKPASQQRENIEKMIGLLTSRIEADIARTRQEEERRLAEEARQRALLDEVLQSLKKASEETKNLGVETEGIEEVETETDIVD